MKRKEGAVQQCRGLYPPGVRIATGAEAADGEGRGGRGREEVVACGGEDGANSGGGGEEVEAVAEKQSG